MSLFKDMFALVLESQRWPVSVRTAKFKNMFKKHRGNKDLLYTAQELWNRIDKDPDTVPELTRFRHEHTGTDRAGTSLDFYKLEINPPGQIGRAHVWTPVT